MMRLARAQEDVRMRNVWSLSILSSLLGVEVIVVMCAVIW